MTTGNAELRLELQRLTVPPEGAGMEWLEVQVREMELLNRRVPHTVRLHTRFSPDIYDYNCFMFALNIPPDAVADMRLGQIFPGQQFVQFLLTKGHLRETETEGPVVIYFRDDRPQHAGRQEAENIISKWGAGGTHIWQHTLWDVPSEYGNAARFFQSLPQAAELYRAWAADRGL